MKRTKVKSIGLGDTVEKVAKAIGADKVAKVYEKVTGNDCGCGKRRDTLNRVFPYDR
jgi:hypothetical protein|tara:strand:- start:218 stop:388 length:171 start_codon:yes stop_codon:yes gene_type:complete